MKNVKLLFNVVSLSLIFISCSAIIPHDTMRSMAGQKDWSKVGTGNLTISVSQIEKFEYNGLSTKLTFSIKNKTNRTFQTLGLNFKVIGSDRTERPTSVIFNELGMDSIQSVSVILINIDPAMIKNLEFSGIIQSTVREGMVPQTVFNVESAVGFESGALSIYGIK